MNKISNPFAAPPVAAGSIEDDISFEDALRGLEQVVQNMESEHTPLADLVNLYERGTKLKARCEALLREAELKIEQIQADENGKVTGVEQLAVPDS